MNAQKKSHSSAAIKPAIPDDELGGEDELGTVVGSATGEADRDVLPGGWEGTDDATSTAPSDLAFTRPDGSDPANEPDKEIDRLWDESEITGSTLSEDELES